MSQEALARARETREAMDQAIRAHADAVWHLQDVLSDDGETNDCILGDILVVAHFTPMDRMCNDNLGHAMPSPQYVMLNPRNLAPHQMHGLVIAAQELIQEDVEITLDMMYPEGDDDDRV